MRVVVTGAAGFLGSHVADGVVTAGHDVAVFDQVVSPYGRRTIVGDLLQVPSLTEAFTGADAVCHLAAVGDVYLAAERPALAASVNVTGTANVCEAALAAGVGRVVVASTWEVYGRPRYEPLDEKHPCDPDHPYNITKLGGERMALAYGHLKKLDVVVLRLGTSFGTRMRPNSVFRIFARRALTGEPITIQGSGAQGRQFTHASDIAAAFVAALTKGPSGAVYNVVAERLVSVRELAEMVVAHAPTRVEYGAARPGDVPSARVSSALAEKELGWRAAVPFEEALRELVNEERASLAAAAVVPSA